MDDRHGRHRRASPDRRRRPAAAFHVASRGRFHRLAEDAFSGLPAELRSRLGRVRIEVADVPPVVGHPVALGRFEPLRAGGGSPIEGTMVLYRRPIEMRAGSRDELEAVIREVAVREIERHHGGDGPAPGDG